MFTLPFHKVRQKLANGNNKGSTELYCLFIADDSTDETPLDSYGLLLSDLKSYLQILFHFRPNLVPKYGHVWILTDLK